MAKGTKKSRRVDLKKEVPDHVSKLLAFVLILIFGVALGFLTFTKNYLPFEGVRGVATIVDVSQSAILLENAKVTDDFYFHRRDIDRFTVRWNEDTVFYLYNSKSQMRNGGGLVVSADNLNPGQNIVVASREKTGNVLTALEVRILPN